MVGTTVIRQVDALDVRVGPAQAAPDLADAASSVLAGAMAFCARKVGIEDPEALAERLRAGEGAACGYCLYGLAKHTATALAQLDDQVKAVYVFDYDATPQDLCFGALGPGVPTVHLIVWTARKTAASHALLQALDRALARAWGDLFEQPQLESLLDVGLIDDDDVAQRRGHGALLCALHQRPIQVWQR